MFCPICKAEYRDGFFTCADCHVDLVADLPPEPEPEFVEFEEILSTYNPADIAVIKSLLEAEAITYFFKGEHFLYLRPLADPTRLMIRKDQASDARNILKDMDLAFMGISISKNDNDDKR